MQVRFNAQPFEDGRDMREFIASVEADVVLDQLDVVVAWVKRSGLEVIESDLRKLAERDCRLRLVVGIDQGGATKQGLELARQLFGEVSVFHDRSGRTFHPKVYIAEGPSSARILVGSNNLTAGGAYFNYEAGIELSLDLPADEELLASFREFFDRLRTDANACHLLTDDVLAELISNPRYRIADEDHRQASLGGSAPAELDTETDVEGLAEPSASTPSIFGRSSQRIKPGPPRRRAPSGSTAAPIGQRVPSVTPGHAVAAGVSAPSASPARTAVTVVKRWFKKLPNSDAQQPQSGNATGALRLTKAGHDIDWRTYFRQDFFAGINWQTSQSQHGQTLDFANVDFHVVINGATVGIRTLRVDHAPHREQGQSNVPTDLKWGVLSPHLLSNDHTGEFVVLELLNDGSYRLEITATDPGSQAFIK